MLFYPPTPTPLPIEPSPLNMPDVSLWNSATYSIQFWNHWVFSAATLALQAFIIIGLALAILRMIIMLENKITEE